MTDFLGNTLKHTFFNQLELISSAANVSIIVQMKISGVSAGNGIPAGMVHSQVKTNLSNSINSHTTLL